MIKAFLFDYDGVMSRGVDVTLPSKRLAENIGISLEEASEAIQDIWAGYSTGELSAEDVWKQIERRTGKLTSSDQRDIWHTWDELEPLPEMLDLVKELRAMDYKVGLVSNVFDGTAEIIREHGVYDNFDFTILSCDVGFRKPQPQIYQIAIEKLGAPEPSDVVFLDDRLHCIDGAKEYGLQTIHVTDHQQAIDKVRSLIGQGATGRGY